MTKERMLDILNCNSIATEEEVLEAQIMYFEQFGVTVKNPDGTYKCLYDILKEANKNIFS